ncbi:hypothetical protein EW026_g1136 [Hermanssonia centrifuga]|uniref:Uncharacterized protein n=1 Tax=Hermanssonia centrifuga TaxID=98765 RepID=A0A4S4KSH9_9APHY|nr:hypothetical protein EW026_g1136 [Hermanssonia centrifuga]
MVHSDLNDDENAPNTAAQQLGSQKEQPSDSSLKRPMSVAERDAATMNAWKEREGSLANAEFEDGSVEGGYRKNVKANIFRYI